LACALQARGAETIAISRRELLQRLTFDGNGAAPAGIRRAAGEGRTAGGADFRAACCSGFIHLMKPRALAQKGCADQKARGRR